ncbi:MULTISPECIES: type IV secretory system conjugative DNA transfer family protein [Niallia]|uniref:type IV secretory system conjugative DNA transfer family protein n=1 Tax=Niallia TaxID=2837506 RepID=UPI00203F8FB6|nr:MULTISPECIES: type IV secretory system conjugative DNA transfer family protein [Niallia]MCM3034150.1 type IV secretory system conjugative DNA transfer family protein [Niallia sp. MER 6]MDK8643828.1 type IV secretory system conjugative DNA transfer family protein [Niallia taxi]
MAIKKRKYLSHSYNYKVDGEELPEKNSKINIKTLLVSISVALIAFLFLNFVVVSFSNVMQSIASVDKESSTTFDIFQIGIEDDIHLMNAFSTPLDWKVNFMILAVDLLLGTFVYSKVNYKSEKEIAYGQKGDSRFTKTIEIEEQYKGIPEKEKEFEGIGGIPISHYKDNYFIDTDTVNTCILGVSRSGKGEIIITPMIDILSRAKEKSSMILNDPKGGTTRS